MTSELELRMSGWSDEEKQVVYDKADRLERAKTDKLQSVAESKEPKRRIIRNN